MVTQRESQEELKTSILGENLSGSYGEKKGMEMKNVLLEETKIGEFLTVGCEQEEEEVGLYIASADVSASCGFKFDEWEKFVEAGNTANSKYKQSKG